MDLNVLIVGGGIHGIGLMHDLATRQISGVHLVERKKLASCTSSKSTKLMHGGLRYLEHLSQWGLVHEALHERTLFLHLLKELVKPLPIVLPHFKESARSSLMVRAGLLFYDLLSGDGVLPSAKSIKKEDILFQAPYLNKDKISQHIESAFLYYDAQMLDDVIARVAAFSSVKLGASYQENTDVTLVEEISGGFKVTLENLGGKKTVTTKYLVNAGGAYCNANLLKWGYIPKVSCLLNIGSHLVFNPEACPKVDVNHACGTLIQEPHGRVVFFIPWNGKWLLGTTESILNGAPSHLKPPQEDKTYLMDIASEYLNLNEAQKNCDEVFCGVRCMPLIQNISQPKSFISSWMSDPFESPFYLRNLDKNISALSRETVIEQNAGGIYSIYGGKWTTYRSISQRLGLEFSRKLGIGRGSGTHLIENWFLDELREKNPEIFISSKKLRELN